MSKKSLKIKWVNGYDIRNTVDTNFAGYSTHDYHHMVPPGELWIEDCLKAELKLILNLLQVETASCSRAVAEARNGTGHSLTLQERHRAESKGFAEARKKLTIEALRRGKPPTFTNRTEKKGSLTIAYVDGRIVRAYLDPYFFLGGHHFVYPYIPKSEVWIDARSDREDQPFTLIHELKERTLMARGMDYPSSHDYALAEERYYRRKKGVASF